MNGIGLLVLIASAGQIGATQPTLSRDFGWEIDQRNPDKALCYIVQISPEIAATMERDAYENTSNMPPELVGRATRIVVRIGNSLLPQEPSLEVLRTMPVVNSPPDAIAQLGNSRMSDVEGKDVVPVQQDRTGAPRLPPLPTNQGAPSSTSPPRTDFGGLPPQGTEKFGDPTKPMVRGTTPGFPNANGGTTGSPPPITGWQGSPSTLGGSLGSDRSRDDASRIADNRFGSQNQYDPGAAGNNGGANPTTGNGASVYGPNYSSPNPPSLGLGMQTGISPVQTPSPGFGNYYPGNQGLGNQGQTKFNPSNGNFNDNSGPGQVTPGQLIQGGQPFPGRPGQSDGQYPSGFNGSQGAIGTYPNNGQVDYGRVDLVASNPTGIASNTGNHSPPPSGDPSRQGTGALGGGGAGQGASPSDGINGSITGPTKSTTVENTMTLLFLFSLLVNVYLGSLMRKLLSRYRALLANMRGQNTPNALGA